VSACLLAAPLLHIVSLPPECMQRAQARGVGQLQASQTARIKHLRCLTDLEVKLVCDAKKLCTGCKSSATKARRVSMAAGCVRHNTSTVGSFAVATCIRWFHAPLKRFCVCLAAWGVHSTGSLQARRRKPSLTASLILKAQPSLHNGYRRSEEF
jgi:hypothetical protein